MKTPSSTGAGTHILWWRRRETPLLQKPVPPQITQERNPSIPELLNHISNLCPPKGSASPHLAPQLSAASVPLPSPAVPGLPGSPSLLPDVGAVGVTPDKRYGKQLVSGGPWGPRAGAREGLSHSLPQPVASQPFPPGATLPCAGDPSCAPWLPWLRGPQHPPPRCVHPAAARPAARAARGARGSVGGRRCWHYCYGGREQRDPPHAQITVSKSVAFSLGGSGASSLASASGVRYSRWCWPQIGVVWSCQRCGDIVSAPRDNNTGTTWTQLGEFPAMHRERKWMRFGWGWR